MSSIELNESALKENMNANYNIVSDLEHLIDIDQNQNQQLVELLINEYKHRKGINVLSNFEDDYE